jgi:glutathione S-transferase
MAGPLLWHLSISHFSEKVRWAFDWTRVPHRRRAMPPGLQVLGGSLLTRGRVITMPVLVTGGETIVDSTDIVAWLESASPARSLYPADADEKVRALELEDWFDENVGPAARQWCFSALLTEPEARAAFAVKQTEWAPFEVPSAVFWPVAKLFMDARYSTGDSVGVEESRVRLLEGLDRLEAELGGGSYLVGDRFSVADLAAAALFYPLVLPPEGPWHPPLTAAFEAFQSTVRERPGFRWVEATFRRHRGG